MARVKMDAPLLRDVGSIRLDVPMESPPRVEVLRNPKSVPGTPEWFDFVFRYVRNTIKVATGECDQLASYLRDLRPYVTEKLGREWEDFCRAELDAEPEWLATIERGVSILKGEGHVGPITQEQAVLAGHGGKREGAGRPATARQTEISASAVSHTDAVRNHVGINQVDRINLNSTEPKGGTSSGYLRARLARDNPDVLSALDRGEFASVRAAARAAGIVKPIDPVAAAHKALAKLTDEQLMTLGCRLDARIFDLLRAGAEE